MPATEISNTADIIDSRDIIARLQELQDERDTLAAERVDLSTNPHVTADAIHNAATSVNEWETENGYELKSLKLLADEGEGYGDWIHGETLIRDSYFRDYAEQLAEDCGMIPNEHRWPQSHLDWDAAADELKQDYMSVDFDGVEYWMRA